MEKQEMGTKEFKVLAVDDERSITAYLKVVLGTRCDVITTNSPKEVLGLAHEHLPDLILCDVEMPEIDGYALCRQLKADAVTSGIPVIFLTSSIEAQGELRAFNAGATDFLLKGGDAAGLEVRIATRVALRRASRALENQTSELETLVAKRTEALEVSQQALRESMHNLRTTKISTGVYWVQVPEAGLYILCGTPADVVKHMMLRGYIAQETRAGVTFETGPNVILLSDKMMQNGGFSNLSEFPVLQMLYRQGMILPGHPNNVGKKPILIGSESQVKAQLDYIYRGNYGLASEDEMRAAGLDETEIKRQMALKLAFAFGKIRSSDELIDSRIVRQEPVEIANDVWIKRIAENRYEFKYRDAVSEVDLDLKADENYESPYSPGHQLVDRQFFGVIHCGEGDGWDLKRQSMSSIVMFQGRYYLVDAGPSVLDTLLRLGIDISEIAGIFHTHAHDDHFAGLPSLILSGHKIKYYATPLVRHSVTKKLSALMSIDENLFDKFFDVCDLVEGQWNDCGGMEVMPIYSPHPVENNIFVFRAIDDDGYKSYAHWADIVAFDVLQKLLAVRPASEVLPKDYLESVREHYLTPVSIKKLDSGGGLIHGQPLDFASDKSGKIILAHRAGAFSREELGVGSQASFGSVEILIASSQDYLRRQAYRFLSDILPLASPDKLDTLMRSSIETYNAGAIILKKGASTKQVFLLLSGTVEYTHPDAPLPFALPTGSILGARALFQDEPLTESWRATSAVRVMSFGVKALLVFLESFGWLEAARAKQGEIDFLQRTWLFGTQITSAKQGRLAVAGRLVTLNEGEKVKESDALCMVRDGALKLTDVQGRNMETVGIGGFIGEERFLGKESRGWSAEAISRTELVALDVREIIGNTPIVLWKLLETCARRSLVEEAKAMNASFNP